MTTSYAQAKPVIADLELLHAAGVKVLATQNDVNVGYAVLTPAEEARVQEIAHQWNRCGGFEALPYGEIDAKSILLTHVFGQLAEQHAKNLRFRPMTSMFAEFETKQEITSALSSVQPANIKTTVEFLSAFADRTYSSSDPNKHIEPMRQRLEAMVKASSLPAQIDVITHKGIKQKSLRVHIEGSTRPSEIIVMGGHLDSINQSWGGNNKAPGADDNASGSAAIAEALRVLLGQKQPERSVEFFFYAGEEGGLLGSAEIAREYKAQGKDVVAVLQLDMVLFPGAGQFVLGSMNDFTSAWLRSYLVTINSAYIKARIIDDKCGYGCSDHASWHRQGYPTIMPFEAGFNTMNHNLHTSRDVIDANSNFEHAAMFSKIAVTIGMDLANSTLREPK